MSDQSLQSQDAAPKLVLARTLEQAPNRAFVNIDSKGQVLSPGRYRASAWFRQAVAAGLLVGAPVVLTLAYGAVGVVVGGVLGGLLGWRLVWSSKVRRAVALLVQDRTAEARVLLQQVRKSAFVPRLARALAEQNLGACHARECNYDQALEHQLAAIALHARGRQTVFAHLVEYASIHTLINLDRVTEARSRLEDKGVADDKGDYLRIQHWVAELHVCMAEGAHALDDEELYRRAREALGITSAASLLGLLAWAHRESDDEEQAWLLLHEALDRKDGTLIERTMPRLGAWMSEHADKAQAFDLLDDMA